jgi:hypothetical protein
MGQNGPTVLASFKACFARVFGRRARLLKAIQAYSSLFELFLFIFGSKTGTRNIPFEAGPRTAPLN